MTRIDDCNALEARVAAGLLTTTDEEYITVLNEINADYQGLSNSFSDLQTAITNLINAYTTEFNAKVADFANLVSTYLENLESLMLTAINELQEGVSIDTIISNLQSTIKDIYEDLRAYRGCGFDYIAKTP